MNSYYNIWDKFKTLKIFISKMRNFCSYTNNKKLVVEKHS